MKFWAKASAPTRRTMYKGGFTMPNIDILRKNLEARGFQTSYFETIESANTYLNRELDGQSIGIGGTMTVREMDLYPLLAAHNRCYWHWEGATVDQAAAAEVYICSLNGVAETGELVNIDGAGNRVASGLFGHKKVYFIIGVNKIAPDLERAVWRARNIAGPKNARRLGKRTPCAVNCDRCYDCASPDRICSALVTYWKRPTYIPEAEIVIINQELGY